MITNEIANEILKCLTLDDLMNKDWFDESYRNKMMAKALGSVHPRFELVSFDQFKKDWCDVFNVDDGYDGWDINNEHDIEDVKYIYNHISLPTRSTKHSAGYDFNSPINFNLNPGESIMIPTGIRSYMPNNMVLMIFPRSGLSTKYRFVPMNLTAIIDSDYYNADNEGHIHMKMVNDGNKPLCIEQGQAFCQGVFTNYFTTGNDTSSNMRKGGFGSTDNR